ncbi:MAG: hypothetical protein U9R56_07030 [candidate division Zixibacteria bacterium]|nr:hypothetical protein [candidate division Zixibacteria bacterium]
MNDSLGLDFLNRTLRTAGIILLIFLPFGIYYLGFYPSLAIFSGGVWGIVNFIFLSAIIRSTIRPDGIDGRRVLILGIIKFPLLYFAGYCLILVPQFTPLLLLIGFSVTLTVMVLKIASRVLLGLDSKKQKDMDPREAV